VIASSAPVGDAAEKLALRQSPLPGAGQTVTYHVYVPTKSGLVAVKPFVQEGAPSWRWTDGYLGPGALSLGWNSMTITVPADAALPLDHLGVQFEDDGTGTALALFYIDSVSW
jgi:hypothetical protein